MPLAIARPVGSRERRHRFQKAGAGVMATSGRDGNPHLSVHPDNAGWARSGGLRATETAGGIELDAVESCCRHRGPRHGSD